MDNMFVKQSAIGKILKKSKVWFYYVECPYCKKRKQTRIKIPQCMSCWKYFNIE